MTLAMTPADLDKAALAIVTLLMGALPTGSGFGEPDLGVVAVGVGMAGTLLGSSPVGVGGVDFDTAFAADFGAIFGGCEACA
mmetsp:Transcript_49136/g.117118  ORF Transcript_49136/g.117118 Transcript_49136/m.117118 type:complete len:82 (+) Transcript_49136:978-1223(+)